MTSSPNDEKKTTDESTNPECSIWCIFDGKAGHEAQTRGLLAALKKKISVSHFEIRAPSRWRSFLQYISKKFPAGQRKFPAGSISFPGEETGAAGAPAEGNYMGSQITDNVHEYF